jgi:hypothetical protein
MNINQRKEKHGTSMNAIDRPVLTLPDHTYLKKKYKC